MRQHLKTICRSNNFPGVSELAWASEGPQNGGKMIGTDIILNLKILNGHLRCINVAQFVLIVAGVENLHPHRYPLGQT